MELLTPGGRHDRCLYRFEARRPERDDRHGSSVRQIDPFLRDPSAVLGEKRTIVPTERSVRLREVRHVFRGFVTDRAGVGLGLLDVFASGLGVLGVLVHR